MRKDLILACLLTAILSAASLAAQEVVHGLAGKVTAIYPATKSIKVATDDGTEGLFMATVPPGTSLNFDKSVKNMTTPAAAFAKNNEQVIVFYIGDDSIRQTVAIKDLGPTPLIKATGTVTKLNKHMLTIQNASGTQETFQIDPQTIAEATNGVVLGEKFSADKGTKVRVTASQANGTETALFIRTVSF